MAKQSASELIGLKIRQFQNFMGFTAAYLRKNNPMVLVTQSTLAAVQELLTVNQKLTRIKNRINFETYKLKKTELILAQNSEHVFLRGRSINQTR